MPATTKNFKVNRAKLWIFYYGLTFCGRFLPWPKIFIILCQLFTACCKFTNSLLKTILPPAAKIETFKRVKKNSDNSRVKILPWTNEFCPPNLWYFLPPLIQIHSWTPVPCKEPVIRPYWHSIKPANRAIFRWYKTS